MAAKALSGGDKLEKYLKETAKKVGKPATLNVGFLEGATYPDGTSVALVAAVQEFGSSARGIPPRSFFRTMIAAKSPEWPDAIAKLLEATDMDAERALAMMGEVIAGELRESIIEVVSPPLSAITLMLRKMKADDPDLVVTGKTVGEAAARIAAGESYGDVSTKPLVETGHMLNSVDYEVKGAG